MADDFAHLHVHSEYSLLDGYSKTTELAKYAAKLGMSSRTEVATWAVREQLGETAR